MSPRKPLPYIEQIARLKSLLRRLRTETRHRYEEIYAASRKRYRCAFEDALQYKKAEAAQELEALTEACLAEIQRQEALSLAEFKPGDRITAELVLGKETHSLGPYLIVDIRPSKGFGFDYEVVEITKKGEMHKNKWAHPLSMRKNLTVRRYEASVSEDAEFEARYYRECAATSVVLALERGDLTLFEAEKRPWGSPSFRRKDRMAP